MSALVPLYVGEQVVAEKFGTTGAESRITIPPKTMAISLQLTDPQRVAGFVSPGSTVAVFASLGTSCASGGTEGVEPQIRLLLPEVSVIGVGQTGVSATTTTAADTGDEVIEQIPTTILTMALDQADAERVMLASQTSCLSLGLLSDTSIAALSAGLTFTDLFNEK